MKRSAKTVALIRRAGWLKWHDECAPISAYEEKGITVIVYPTVYADGCIFFSRVHQESINNGSNAVKGA